MAGLKKEKAKLIASNVLDDLADKESKGTVSLSIDESVHKRLKNLAIQKQRNVSEIVDLVVKEMKSQLENHPNLLEGKKTKEVPSNYIVTTVKVDLVTFRLLKELMEGWSPSIILNQALSALVAEFELRSKNVM